MSSSEPDQPPDAPRLRLTTGAILCFVVLVTGLGLSTSLAVLLHYRDPRLWMFYGAPLVVVVLCFVLRLYAWCGWKHLLLSAIPTTLLAMILMNWVFHVSLGEWALYLWLGVLLATLLLPGAIGLLGGWWVAKRWNSTKSRRVAVLAAIALALCVPISHWLVLTAKVQSQAQVMGQPELLANADQLQRTEVVPTLDHPITSGANLVWCATFQLAWNELCSLVEGELQLEPRSEVAQSLNRRSVTRNDLDSDTYVTATGAVGDGLLGEIQDRVQTKFEEASVSEFTPPLGLSDDWLVAYGFLFVDLPFQWAFERLDWPLEFGGTEVECFGIDQYLKIQSKERLAAGQILIYDARGKDDFILELKTRRTAHHLILAKVPPLGTLSATIQSVEQRIANSEPESLGECQDFVVPVLNFDIHRDYGELAGRPISVKNERFHGQQIAMARQQIRFRLDERGAVLKSEAIVALGLTQNLVFNKPFLVMLRYGKGKSPYFALWVDNAELLVEFSGQE